MATPVTTLFPTAAFPSCYTACGVLYDVNGGCVPPAAATADASSYDSCFCNDPRLSSFRDSPSGLCSAACAATTDAASIQNWFTSFCNDVATVDPAAATTTTSSSSTSTATSGASNQGGGGNKTWLDNHYQWVIFLVIMVVAIIGIWVGACVWRRRYVRKKDRVYALGNNLARSTGSGRVVPNASSAGSIHVPSAGFTDPAPISSAGVYGEKPQKKKWGFGGRT